MALWLVHLTCKWFEPHLLSKQLSPQYWLVQGTDWTKI